MTDPDVKLCPFVPSVRALDAPDSERARMHARGPAVAVETPAGGPAWVITDPTLARAVLADDRFAKDPALAPAHWDRRSAGLEPTAAEQMSLTTLDGPSHARLRKTFAPLFSVARMRTAYPRMLAVARRLLADAAAAHNATEAAAFDVVADFSTRYPLAVVCDLFDIPADQLDQAISACRLMPVDYPAHVGEAMAGFAALARAALLTDDGPAQDLAARMPDGSTRGDLEYQIFTILFTGQLTTDPTIGFLVAHLLRDGGGGGGGGGTPTDLAAVVRSVLTEHPPAPFSLWRFTTTEVELAGATLPAHTPVLVDIQGINDRLDDGEHDLTFGAGPHYCIGAQLAQLELQALAEVLTTDYRDARLLIDHDALRQETAGGIMGGRVVTLPVVLR